LCNLSIVVFDKTGTLTKGVFEVTNVLPSNGFTGSELLHYAAVAEAHSNHPIALSITKAYGRETEKNSITDYKELPGYGVSAVWNGKTLLAGSRRLMANEKINFEEPAENGTKVYLAVGGVYAGCIVISDEIKPDSRQAIAGLRQRGVGKTVMLTGDNAQTAHAVAGELQIDEVYAGLLPAQKIERVESLAREKNFKGKLAFVGDGINDAPVLARADIGIAMGGFGSDAAIEAADVVLMTDEPSKLTEAIDIARFTRRIVWQNIVFALGVKGLFLLLGGLGVASMWEAVFADVGVTVLAVLNAARVMGLKGAAHGPLR
jgi:Cd2+/Zn2+-exporting ATPase